MSRSKLIVMCGLSGSGKSTIAKKLAEDMENTVIVSSDKIREEVFDDYGDTEHNADVFKIYHKRVKNALDNNHNVIADATNLTMKSRRATLENVKGMDIERICYIVPKPFEQCKTDNLNREYPVPDDVLDKQIRRFQVPFMEEGWDHIKIHNLHVRADTRPTVRQMYNFDQKTPYHDKTLWEHCIYTAKLFTNNFCYPYYYTFPAIFHDIAKLFTQTFDENGIAHYYGHAEYSSWLFLSEYHDTFSDLYDDEFLDCCFLINYHMLPFGWEKATEKTKQRWKKRFGEYKYQMLLDFHKCDITR